MQLPADPTRRSSSHKTEHTKIRLLDHKGRPAAGASVQLVALPAATEVIATAKTDASGVAVFDTQEPALVRAWLDRPAQQLEVYGPTMAYSVPGRSTTFTLSRVMIASLRAADEMAFYATVQNVLTYRLLGHSRWTRSHARRWPRSFWLSVCVPAHLGAGPGYVEVRTLVHGHASQVVKAVVVTPEGFERPQIIDRGAVAAVPWSDLEIVVPASQEGAKALRSAELLPHVRVSGTHPLRVTDLIGGKPGRLQLPSGQYEIYLPILGRPFKCWQGSVEPGSKRVILTPPYPLGLVELSAANMRVAEAAIRTGGGDALAPHVAVLKRRGPDDPAAGSGSARFLAPLGELKLRVTTTSTPFRALGPEVTTDITGKEYPHLVHAKLGTGSRETHARSGPAVIQK